MKAVGGKVSWKARGSQVVREERPEQRRETMQHGNAVSYGSLDLEVGRKESK